MVLGLRLERHPVLAEVAIAAGLALRRVAAIDVLLGALGQADERELPVELGAVAPAQRGQGRRRGVGPRAAWVGEVPDGDRLHKQHCGTWPPSARAAPPRRLTAVARARALAHRTRTRRCHVAPGGAPSMPSPATTTLPIASPVCGAPGARAVVALTAAGVASGGMGVPMAGADGEASAPSPPEAGPQVASATGSPAASGRGARRCAAAAGAEGAPAAVAGTTPTAPATRAAVAAVRGRRAGRVMTSMVRPLCESCRRNA